MDESPTVEPTFKSVLFGPASEVLLVVLVLVMEVFLGVVPVMVEEIVF